MSRIGKKPVALPAGVTARVEDGKVIVKGAKGELSMSTFDLIDYTVEDGQIIISPANKTKQARQFWGMQRTLVQNLVDGVTVVWSGVLTSMPSGTSRSISWLKPS